MLTAIVHQMVEQVICLSTSDEAIELAELMEDIEEEELREHNLLVFQGFGCIDFEEITKEIIEPASYQFSLLEIHLKIPVPPPELV